MKRRRLPRISHTFSTTTATRKCVISGLAATGLAVIGAGWLALGVSAEETVSLKLPSEGVAFWNTAVEAFDEGSYIDALQKLKWYQGQVQEGDAEWHPDLVSFLRIRCAVGAGHFEKAHALLDSLDIHKLPPPLRYQAQVLRWKRRLSGQDRNLPLPDPIDGLATAPMAEARLASVKGRVQESEGEPGSALESYAKSIVLAPPEDQDETRNTIQRVIKLLTVSGHGEEAARMIEVQAALYGEK